MENNKKYNQKKIPPLLNPDNSLAITDCDKANLFGKHLSEIFQPHTDQNSNTILVYRKCTKLSQKSVTYVTTS